MRKEPTFSRMAKFFCSSPGAKANPFASTGSMYSLVLIWVLLYPFLMKKERSNTEVESANSRSGV